MPIIPDYITENFCVGWITSIEPESLPPGAVSDGLNWVVKEDKVELRRGTKLLGVDAGAGSVTGLGVGKRIGDTEIMFRTRARKIEYYLTSADAWVEVGTNTLPTAASGEEVAIEPYTSLSGYAMYLSSPTSSIYKLMLEHPGDVIDMSSTTHRGRIRIKKNAMWLFQKKSSNNEPDRTGAYRSKLDKDVYSDYTAITSENIGTGDGSTKTFNDTLAFKAGGAKRSCFGISATDGTETFTDNFDGTLTGSLGGTGTINYATGVISVTFNTAPTNLQAITADGYYEDPTSGGIADFAFSATRAAGEGFVLRQDEGGGDFQNIGEYDDIYYCFHEKKTWSIELAADDSDASNLLYRDKVGIPNWRSIAETGEGIYYIDTSNESDVRIRLLTLHQLSTKVVPRSISDGLDLSNYRFNKAAMKVLGDLLCITCRTSGSTTNNRMLVYDRRLNLWYPPMDYLANVLELFEGALVGGDSITNNVYELFSGFDDDDSLIQNFLIFENSRLNSSGLKDPHRFVIGGEIQREQKLKISVSIDNGSFIEIGGSDDDDGNHTYAIEGDGDYVDQGVKVNVGTTVIGTKEIGGGGDGVEASPYQKEFKIDIDKLERVEIKVEAVNIGYISISRIGFKDIRYKGRRLPNKYL